jgi:DNA-binding MarR family transcriptional regulator
MAPIGARRPPPRPREGQGPVPSTASGALWTTVQVFMIQMKIAVKAEGLTMPQAWLLPAIGHGGSTTPTALARRIELTPPAMTSALEHLEERGLVRREHVSEDRRRVRVSLTPRGERVLAGLERRQHAIHERVDRALSARERSSLIRDLRKVAASLGDGNRWGKAGCRFCATDSGGRGRGS